MILLAGSGEGPVLAADQDQPLRLEEVVTSATRTPEPAGQVPASVTVFSKEEIEDLPYRTGPEVDDLLRQVPGVQPANLSSRYNHPTAQAVSLRGLGNRRTLVLLDGIPLNDGFGGWINWGLIPDDIARIEVSPGGGSNLYGTWAMGGVIQIVTDPATLGPGFRSRSSAGNFSTYTQSVTARYGTSRLGWSLGYRWFHTNGFIPVPTDQRGPVDRTNDTRHQQFMGKLAWDVTPGTRLTVSGNLFREDQTFGTSLSLAARTIGTFSVGLKGKVFDEGRWQTRWFGQWQTFRNLTSRVLPSPTVREREVRDRIQAIPSNDFGGMWQVTMPVESWGRVVVGGDARAILAQSAERVFDLGGDEVGRSLARGKQVGWGLFGEWLFEPVPRVTVIPSVRWDWWTNFDGLIQDASGDVTMPSANVESVVNPKVALQYRITDRLRAAASFYQAFRAPTLNELYRGFGFAGFRFLPNENLGPERLTGGDVMLERTMLSDRRLRVRVTGHVDKLEDQILFVSQDPLTVRRENVGRTRIVGAEASLDYTVSPLLALRAGYAYVDATVQEFEVNPEREGNQVPFVSRHQVTAALTVGDLEWVQVTLQGRYLSRQFADDRNMQPVADMVVIDASLQKGMGAWGRVFLDIENLTDQRYLATQTGPVQTIGAPLLVTGGAELALDAFL